MRLVQARKCVFIISNAGTEVALAPAGHCKRALGPAPRDATATTGIAAHNLSGMTLYHFADLDTRSSASASDLVRHIQHNKDALLRWRDVDVLVLDEATMLDDQFSDALEAPCARS